MKINLVGVVSILLILSGCSATNTSLYQWGNYQSNLQRYYQAPGNQDTMLLDMLQHIRRQESKGQRVAPGLYAEVGTLYFEQRDTNKAIEFYKKEHDTWPESKPLMTAMIKTLSSFKK